jgi:hypothetical protein
MLVVMSHSAQEEDIQRVIKTIEEMGYQARPMPGSQRTAGWWGTTRACLNPAAAITRLSSTGPWQRHVNGFLTDRFSPAPLPNDEFNKLPRYFRRRVS